MAAAQTSEAAPKGPPSPSSPPPGLHRSIGPWQAAALVVGSIVGTGVFLKTATMAQLLGSMGGVLTAAGIIGVLYASGAFVVGPATFATALPPAHRYDAAGNVRLPISLVRQGRIAHGDVVLLRSGELAFVCLKDESAAAAAAGKAVANQFGLVGALVGAAVSAARESGREEEIARLRHHAMQWPLEQQLSAHALNLRLPAQHLVEFHGGGWFTAMHLRTPSEQLVVHAIEPHDLPVLRGWLAHFGVAQRG